MRIADDEEEMASSSLSLFSLPTPHHNHGFLM